MGLTSPCRRLFPEPQDEEESHGLPVPTLQMAGDLALLYVMLLSEDDSLGKAPCFSPQGPEGRNSLSRCCEPLVLTFLCQVFNVSKGCHPLVMQRA